TIARASIRRAAFTFGAFAEAARSSDELISKRVISIPAIDASLSQITESQTFSAVGIHPESESGAVGIM
ncbi:hypothetical protein, partial [Jiella sonneratiae]